MHTENVYAHREAGCMWLKHYYLEKEESLTGGAHYFDSWHRDGAYYSVDARVNLVKLNTRPVQKKSVIPSIVFAENTYGTLVQNNCFT